MGSLSGSGIFLKNFLSFHPYIMHLQEIWAALDLGIWSPSTLVYIHIDLGPDSRKLSSLSQISAEILLKSEILVSAEILLKLRFTKGISAETKISAKFWVWTNQNWCNILLRLVESIHIYILPLYHIYSHFRIFSIKKNMVFLLYFILPIKRTDYSSKTSLSCKFVM